MNITLLNIHVYIYRLYRQQDVLQHLCSRVEELDCRECAQPTLKDKAKLFSKVFVQIYMLTSGVQELWNLSEN